MICPVYNAEEYLRRGVESVLSQTFRDFEFILVDDGSRDGSGAICDEYAEADPRVKVIHKPNGGVATARQAGMDVSEGEYFIHFDSDDWADPDWLGKMYEVAVRDDADVVICDYVMEFEDHSDHISQSHPDYSQEQIADAVARGVISIPLWNKLIRKSLFDAYGLHFPEELKTAEDAFVTHSIFIRGAKTSFCVGPCYHYDRFTCRSALTRTGYERSLDAIRHCVMLLERAEGSSSVRERSLFTMKSIAKMKAFYCLPSGEFVSLYKEINRRYVRMNILKVSRLECYVAIGIIIRNNSRAMSLFRRLKSMAGKN